MNNNIFQHNSSCVLGVTFSLTLEKAMVGDLGESLCLKKYWFCSLRKETLVSYYICKFFMWHGRRLYKVTFQISLEKDEPTLLKDYNTKLTSARAS